MNLRAIPGFQYLPDELLSSWVVRWSLASGCAPGVMTAYLWPGRRVWATDIDRGSVGYPKSPITLTQDEFVGLTLYPLARQLAGGDVDQAPFWPWILAVGCRNRRRHGGLQFCPRCLSEDGKPYFRRHWRLAWYTQCLIHGISLQDRCERCSHVLEPHRLSPEDGVITVCVACKADLRLQYRQTDLVRMVGQFELWATRVLQQGSAFYGDQNLSAVEWFELARYLLVLIRRAARHGNASLAKFFERLGVNLTPAGVSDTGLVFELLPGFQRAALLAMVAQVIHAGPEGFVAAAQSSGLTKSSLAFDGHPIQSCLLSHTASLPQGGRCKDRLQRQHIQRSRPNSKATVERMLALLKRKAGF